MNITKSNSLVLVYHFSSSNIENASSWGQEIIKGSTTLQWSADLHRHGQFTPWILA
jgi:hypothetical protein